MCYPDVWVAHMGFLNLKRCAMDAFGPDVQAELKPPQAVKMQSEFLGHHWN